MATKPTLADSRWAVNGSDVDAANVSAPTSGQRDTGYTLNQVPPSSVENYLRNRVYRWLQYLNDGAFTGNHSITGTLTVSALATLASAAVTGAATVGGTLGVTGPATLNSTLSVVGSVTVGANSNVTISGAGTFKHGTKTILIAPAEFHTNATTSSITVSGLSISGSSAAGFAPIQIQAGSRILEIRVRVVDSATGPTRIRTKLFNTGAVALAQSSLSSGAGSTQTLTIPSVPTTTATGFAYFISVLSETGTAPVDILWAEVDFDVP